MISESAASAVAPVGRSHPRRAEPSCLRAPSLCGEGRGKVDASITDFGKVYGWLGHYVSFSEIDASNSSCDTADEKRTNTWDTAAGVELTTRGHELSLPKTSSRVFMYCRAD